MKSKKPALVTIIMLAIVLFVAALYSLNSAPSGPSSTVASTSPMIVSTQTDLVSTTSAQGTESNLTTVWMSASDFNVTGKVYQLENNSADLRLELNITNRFNAPVTYVNASIGLVALNFSDGESVPLAYGGAVGERHVRMNRLRMDFLIPNLPPNVIVTSARYVVTTYVQELHVTITWNIVVPVPSTFTR